MGLHRGAVVAIRAGAVSILRICLASSDVVNDVDEEGRTLLMLAASLGRLAECVVLVEYGAEILVGDSHGRRAVDYADESGHIALSSWLAEMADDCGDSPFASAAITAGDTATPQQRPAEDQGDVDRSEFQDRRPLAQHEERHSQLKQLIVLGKERGYLTYAQVNDCLPSEIVDPEQIEEVVNTFAEMGLPVYKTPPEDGLLLAPGINRLGVDDLDIGETDAAFVEPHATSGKIFNVDNLQQLMTDVLADPTYDSVVAAKLREVVRSSLDELTFREAEVLTMRFGFDGIAARTLEDIAEHLEVSRTRVLEIEALAFDKLKSSRVANHLRSFLDRY